MRPTQVEPIPMRMNPLPTLLKFDRQLPVYNWLYPFTDTGSAVSDPFNLFTQIDPHPRRRALYFHVPFCDTICSFCPFTRGPYAAQEEVDRFAGALLQEIAVKHQYPAFSEPPVDCIYFGGGTPSVLSVEHFYRLGEALHRSFDLSRLKEFTIECEVKSVTLEKLKAWQEIGVNRISFGVQTFNPLYRELFTMTATVDQIRRVAAWVNERFPCTDVDMIYAMAGQTLDDFIADVDAVLELGMTTVEFYILTNVVSQPRLHRAFAEHGLRPLSAAEKMSFRMYLNEYLRARGHVPNNSYAFTRSTAPAGSPRVVIQREPTFLYQDIAYGFTGDFVDAYGAGAMGTYGPYAQYGIPNREQYAARLLGGKRQPWFTAYERIHTAEKGIVYFPYRGVLHKSDVAWDEVHPDTRAALDESVTAGLAVDHGDRYELTEAGWLFSVDYMYSLMPRSDQQILSELVAHSTTQGRTRDELRVLPLDPVVASAAPAAVS